MKPTMWTGLGMLAFVAAVVGLRPIGVVQTMAAQAGGTTARQMPQFQVDPAWPKLPAKWVLGLVSNVAVDSQDHVWVLQRPDTVKPEQKAMAAPPVLEFDAAGNFVQGWGGPGAGYEWPESEHGISFDQKGNVWLAGSDEKDGQLLKFTKDGKFVMQVGRKGQSKGNADTQNMHGAADVVFYAKTNEIFVADGYFNNRVIVLDADTGRFKRMWGAFGNAPTDPPGGKRPAPVPGRPRSRPVQQRALAAHLERRPRVRHGSGEQAGSGLHAGRQIHQPGFREPERASEHAVRNGVRKTDPSTR